MPAWPKKEGLVMSWLQLPRFLRSRRPSSPGKTGARAATARPPFRKTVLFEAMEPRLLLSADPLVTVVGGDVTVTFDGTDNDVLLSINAGAGGGLVVAQTNTTLNSVLIPVPTGSLTLNLGFGADRLAVANLSSLGAFNLVVNDPNDVTIISDVRLNGALTVNAGEDIVVNDNLAIDVGGNITFNVVAGYALTWAAITPVFQNLDAIGSIEIGDNVLLDGSNITLSVETNNTKQAEFEIDEIALQSFTPAQLANIFIPALPEGVTVSFADAGGANLDTITRSSGLWADDGFVVGQFIEVAGTTSNNGFFQIASVSGATMTLVAGNALVNEANVAAQLEVVRLMTGSPALTFADNGAAADTITRSAGSWLTDGFAVGQSVIVRGTLDGVDAGTEPDNDGEFLIASLNATTITLQPADTLVNQTQSGVTAFVQGSPGEMPLAVIDPNVKLDGHIPLTFANAGSADTITRTSGSWLADGFVAGQEVIVVGTALNNGAFRIASLSATVMTLTSSASLTNETSSRADITSVNSLDGGVQEGATQQNATTVAVTFAGSTVTRAGVWSAGFAVGDELVVFGSTSNDGSYRITAVAGGVITVAESFTNETTSDATISNLDAVTLTFSAGQIARSSGNWVTDGFAVGQQLSVEGSLNNDGGYVITALTATTLTVAAPGFGAFTAEVTQAADITYIVSLADPLITFDAATGTITRNTGSWIDDGFVAGRNISVDLSQENNALYRVTAVSATTLTLAFTPASGLALTNELARFVEVKGIVPNQAVTGDANTPATAASVFAGLGGALPSNILGNIGGLTSALNGYFAHAVQGESTGTITLGAGADLIASGDVTVLAHAISNVAVKTKGLIIGVSYAQSIAHASVDVQANVIINAAGNLNITSDADNTMASAVKVVAGFHPIIAARFKQLVPGPALGLSYGEADSQAMTTIAGGAQLFGDNVTIAATDTNDFNVTTKAKIKGIKVPNLGNSIAVSLSFVESDADVTVNGNVTARDGDVKIDASSIDLNNDVVAIAAVKRALGGAAGKAAGLAGGAGLKPASSSGAIGIAGGVAYAISNNAANATVGSTATLFANRDLSVTAYAEDNFKAIAIAGAKLASTVSIAGGVAITDYTNTADAVVGNGATLNVRGLLTVRANAIIPNQVEIDDKFRELIGFRPFLAPSPVIASNPAISPTDPISGVATTLSDGATTLSNFAAFGTETLAENAKLLGLIKPFIKHKLIVPNLLATTYTEASSGAKDKDSGEVTKIAISGSVNVTDVENSAKAHVGQGALVNQDPALLALATQGVAVLAKASVESIHVAGMTNPLSLIKSLAGKPGAAGNKGQNAIGGTYLGVNYTGTAEAWVEDGAKVKAGAGGITVRADNHDLLIAIAQSGGVAEKIGITGSFLNYDSRHNTRAWVEDRAVLDSGGNIDVIAHADILAVEVTGAIESGGKVAAGAAIALTDVLNTTEAFIGNKLAPVGVVSAGSVDADGNINIAADVDEQTITVAIAGAFVGGSASGQGPSNAQGNGPTNKTGGVGISGAVAINTLSDTTRAFVAGTTLSTLDATPGDLSVTADTSASGVAVTGAFVISKSKSGSIGIAGGFGMNDLTRNTEAYVEPRPAPTT
jgi:hypothetical protein